MNILDIHTHNLACDPYKAIISCTPQEFMPKQGYYYSVGYHPWYLSPDANEDWNLLNNIVNNHQVLAIGEAGLDKMRGINISIQADAFEKQIHISLLTGKPLIIHSVHTANEIIQLKKKIKPDNPWIIHGFRGKKELAQQLLNHGFYLSLGEIYHTETLQIIPHDRLFLETDESEASIHTLYERAAHLLALPVHQLIEMIQQNISNVFFK